jgi:hypothetical protein
MASATYLGRGRRQPPAAKLHGNVVHRLLVDFCTPVFDGRARLVRVIVIIIVIERKVVVARERGGGGGGVVGDVVKVGE